MFIVPDVVFQRSMLHFSIAVLSHDGQLQVNNLEISVLSRLCVCDVMFYSLVVVFVNFNIRC